MRKLFLVMIFLTFIRIDSVEAAAVYHDGHSKLANFTNEELKLTNESWEVTMKEKMSAERIQKQLENMSSEFQVTKKTTEQATTYTLHNKYHDESEHDNDPVSVSYQAIIPNQFQETGEWKAVISGEQWSEQVYWKYIQTKKSVLSTFLSQNVQEFTCLKLQNDDTINKVTFLNELAKNFNITYQMSQNDSVKDGFKTKEVYGYTKSGNEQIMVDNKPMNIHIAFVQKGNENEKIIIGTPILTNEY